MYLTIITTSVGFYPDCPSGRYGDRCATQCGQCGSDVTRSGSVTPCHPETGICQQGCQDWYITEMCDVHIGKFSS